VQARLGADGVKLPQGGRMTGPSSQGRSIRDILVPGHGALAAVAAVVAALLLSCAESRTERIILIVVDTLRSDHLSPYGSQLETPNVAALAERGQVFTNAISSFHQTTMSMAALLTGRTPSLETGVARKPLPWTGQTWCGLSRLAVPQGDTCVPRGLTTLAEELRDSGYWTAAVVSNLLLFEPLGYEQGFDRWVQVAPRADQPMKLLPQARAESRSAAHVQRGVEELLARRPSDRFFLYVHYIDVHDWNLMKTEYGEAVELFDRDLGKLLEYLGAQGLLDRAVVIFTSDHGEALGEEHPLKSTRTHLGNPSFEPVLRVPLIIAPPQFDDASRLVRSQDIPGLIKQIAGVAAQEARDLEPDEVFLSEKRWRTYRKGRWKSMSRRGKREAWLFDIEADPDETVDVAEQRPVSMAEHRKRIAQLTKSLAGQVSEGEKLTERDRARLRALGYLPSD
jgi:arylsulfatase A-like enzyme